MREIDGDQAQTFVEKLESSGPDSDLVHWIVATYNRDQQEIDRLASKEENKKYMSNLQFEILSKTAKLYNP